MMLLVTTSVIRVGKADTAADIVSKRIVSYQVKPPLFGLCRIIPALRACP